MRKFGDLMGGLGRLRGLRCEPHGQRCGTSGTGGTGGTGETGGTGGASGTDGGRAQNSIFFWS